MDTEQENLLKDAFLSLYLFLLEKELNKPNSGLEKVKFQSAESNTDEYLKNFIKKIILKHKTIENCNIKSVEIDNNNVITDIGIEVIKKFKILSVLLPKQLSEKQKLEISSTKKSVYTNPDLYLKISDGKKTFYESIELKSTKNNEISGSSVQQISPFERVIFIKRTTKEVTSGFYINSITEKLPFPDRSPRPKVGFKTLLNWNKNHRKLEGNILKIKIDTVTNDRKIKLLEDWQNYLANEWIQVIKANEVRKGEKWFNNAIRKFAIKFLEYSENLTEKERQQLKEKLNNLIKNK